jgi:hypothetical protein
VVVAGRIVAREYWKMWPIGWKKGAKGKQKKNTERASCFDKLMIEKGIGVIGILHSLTSTSTALLFSSLPQRSFLFTYIPRYPITNSLPFATILPAVGLEAVRQPTVLVFGANPRFLASRVQHIY